MFLPGHIHLAPTSRAPSGGIGRSATAEVPLSTGSSVSGSDLRHSAANPDVVEAPLLRILNLALASSIARSGPHLACRPGCAQCCHGVFQISALDAHRLRQALAAAEPSLKSRIESRIEQARTRLLPFFPGNPQTGVLSADDQAVGLFEEWAHADPCPILDPATQTCDLYAARPILCRTFGPPIRNDPADLEAGLSLCELCFTHATEDEIVAAETDSTFRLLQDSEEEAYERTHPNEGATIVAFAFGLPVKCEKETA